MSELESWYDDGALTQSEPSRLRCQRYFWPSTALKTCSLSTLSVLDVIFGAL